MNKARILLVEDDALTRFMMHDMLDMLGVDVEEASDGQACLDMLEQDSSRFDLILMDIHMPVKTGLDAIRAIRDHADNPPRNLPVYAVTADEAWQDRTRAQQEGFHDVIPKPISTDKLRAALDRLGA